MVAIADGIELFLQIMSRDAASKPACEKQSVLAASLFCYVAFGFLWLVVWTKCSNQHFSAVLTAGSFAQCLGFLLLTIKVRATKSVSGLSSGTIEMYIAFFVCRLGSTCFNHGYLPADRSGKSVYQLMDIGSLLLAVQLLYCIHKTHRWTYQREQDTLPMAPLVPPCLVLAYFFHAGLSRSLFFDTLWAASLYIDTLALVPQLWMLTKIGGRVEGLTSNFVALLCASRGLGFVFWHRVYTEIAPKSEGSESMAIQILVAHGLQLLFAADFMFYYLRGKYTGRGVVLPDAEETGVLTI